MKTLRDKILAIYPDLVATPDVFTTVIRLQNDGTPVPKPGTDPQEYEPLPNPDADRDANGDYIAVWNHPTLQRPTQSQLDSVV